MKLTSSFSFDRLIYQITQTNLTRLNENKAESSKWKFQTFLSLLTIEPIVLTPPTRGPALSCICLFFKSKKHRFYIVNRIAQSKNR